MNSRITLLKTLKEVGLRILTSILFHSIITAGKKIFFEVCFCLEKRDLTFFNTSCIIVLFSGSSVTFLDNNFKCRKKLIDKLIKGCSEDIDGDEMIYNVTSNDYEKVCNSRTIYIVLLVITF